MRTLAVVLSVFLCLILFSSAQLLLRGNGELFADTQAKTVIKVGSFNVQVFGTKKMGHGAVVDVLIETLSRYDIVFVQESMFRFFWFEL